MTVQKTVYQIHFDDFSGFQFERLAFAYITRFKNWSKLEWLGQTGKDGGRDIWGEHLGETYCYQCANYKSLTVKKATEDIDKLHKAKTISTNFVVICGGLVTVKTRGDIVKYAHGKGFKNAAVWSGAEFEEKLRKETPELIKRFVEGDEFPDSPKDLAEYSKAAFIADNNDIVKAILQNFDRPAFTTRFRNESSLPNFDKALEDTIALLNTGIHRLRDGTLINKLPSRHRITDDTLKKSMDDLTKLVISLRDQFHRFKRDGEIKGCSCGLYDCTTVIISDKAADSMDELRTDIFKKLKEIDPELILDFSN